MELTLPSTERKNYINKIGFQKNPFPPLYKPDENYSIFNPSIVEDEILKYKKIITNNKLKKIILITGDKGTGKSALLRYIFRHHIPDNSVSFFWTLPYQGSISSSYQEIISFLGLDNLIRISKLVSDKGVNNKELYNFTKLACDDCVREYCDMVDIYKRKIVRLYRDLIYYPLDTFFNLYYLWSGYRKCSLFLLFNILHYFGYDVYFGIDELEKTFNKSGGSKYRVRDELLNLLNCTYGNMVGIVTANDYTKNILMDNDYLKQYLYEIKISHHDKDESHSLINYYLNSNKIFSGDIELFDKNTLHTLYKQTHNIRDYLTYCRDLFEYSIRNEYGYINNSILRKFNLQNKRSKNG